MIFFSLRSQRRGFTMLEMMVVLALSVIAGYIIFAITRAGNEQANAREALMSINESAREGLYKATQELRQSAPSKISIDSSGHEITFSVPDPENFIDGEYEIDWESAHSIRYYLGGVGNTQLLRVDTSSDDDTPVVMANNVTAISFSANSNSSIITVTFSVQKTTADGKTIPKTPLQLSATAALRNT